MQHRDAAGAHPPTTSRLTLELLTWIDERRRTYAETIDAWRSSCPRLTIWEDALTDELVAVVRQTGATSTVALTPRGRELLSSPAVSTRP